MGPIWDEYGVTFTSHWGYVGIVRVTYGGLGVSLGWLGVTLGSFWSTLRSFWADEGDLRAPCAALLSLWGHFGVTLELFGSIF